MRVTLLVLDFPSLWVFPAGESHQLVGDSTFGFSRPGILPGVQSVRVVVTPAVDKEEGGPMDTSQRTESRVMIMKIRRAVGAQR